MKTTNYILGLLLAVAFVLPTGTNAQTATEHTAIRLNDDFVLFNIGYRTNFLNRDINAPLYASHATATTTRFANFEISNAPQNTLAAGIVIASPNRATEDHSYKLAAGESTNFNLIVIAKLPVATRDYVLNVSNLPFIVKSNERRGEDGLILTNSSTLETLKSPAVR